MMPITKLTPDSMVTQTMQEGLQRLENALIYNLCYVGEQCLNAARSTNSYKDQTGNLRSSLGYIVVSNGKVVSMSSFATVKGGSSGSANGRKYVEKLVKEFPHSIALVVVAGMQYAAHVSAKGYDVLDSAQVLAEKLVPQMLNQLNLK